MGSRPNELRGVVAGQFENLDGRGVLWRMSATRVHFPSRLFFWGASFGIGTIVAVASRESAGQPVVARHFK